MRRFLSSWIVAGMLIFQGGIVSAQSTLQTLKEELKEAADQRQQATAQTLSNFFAQIDPAMGGSDAAMALYQQAGGTLPEVGAVITNNENETATEKEQRLAFDQANLSRLATALQIQCGLMHYAALLVVKPDQPGLQGQWVSWLRSAAPLYPHLNVPGGAQQPTPEKHKKKKGDDGQADPKTRTPFNPVEEEHRALKDSVISKFLTFTAWNDKEQGEWSVHDLPKLYRANVLEPLRTAPTQATLEAWDVYIAMLNADEPDNDKWNQVDYPPLAFDRACDDYAAEPASEKLEALVNMIKANPMNSHADDWIARVSKFMDDYSAKHGGTPAAAPTPPATTATSPSNPNVTVTTQQQGDMTIITTHTNAAPVAPAH